MEIKAINIYFPKLILEQVERHRKNKSRDEFIRKAVMDELNRRMNDEKTN